MAPRQNIVPVDMLAQQARSRVQEQGKIKTGVTVPAKAPRGRPKAIDTFRFVSSDRVAIEALAELYGIHSTEKPHPSATAGEIWQNDRKQWDFVSRANEVRVVLPGDPLGGTPLYEAWSGKGGADRRCNGRVCTVRTVKKVGDGDEEIHLDEMPCLCRAALDDDPDAEVPCRLTTRLSVILPDVRFQGQWQFSSTSDNVGREMQQMVGLIAAALARGLTHAVLRLEWRQRPGRKFTVPIIGFDHSIAELEQGAGLVQIGGGRTTSGAPALTGGVMRELGAGGGDDDGHHDVEVLASDEQRSALREQWGKMTPASKQALTDYAREHGIDMGHPAEADAMRLLTRGAELVSGQYAAGEEPFE